MERDLGNLLAPVIQQVEGRGLIPPAEDEDVAVVANRDVGGAAEALCEHEDLHAVLVEDPDVVLALVQRVDLVSLVVDRELGPMRQHRTREVGERIAERGRHPGERQVHGERHQKRQQ